MKISRHLGALMALGALTALPGCSSGFGGGSAHAAPQYSQQNYAPPASYNMGSGNQTAMNNNNDEVVPTSKALVRKVQRELKRNGDYNDHIDGLWGPVTENGVRKWQQAHNLHVNGAIDMATLESMNISPGNQNQENAGNNNNQTYGNNGSTQPYGNNNGQANNNGNYGNNNGQANNGQTYGNNNGQATNGHTYGNNNETYGNNRTNGGAAQAGVNNGAASGQNNQANENGTNGTNYSTEGNRQTGNTYSNNNMPTPPSNGTATGNDTGMNNGMNNNGMNNNGTTGTGTGASR